MSTLLHITLYLLWFTFLHEIASETITCHSKGGSCKCPNKGSGTCTLDCSTQQDSCQDAKLTCRANDPCIIDCRNDNACSGNSILNAATASSVQFLCDSKDSCKDATIICPSSGSCSISCVGEDGCDSSSIDKNDAQSFSCSPSSACPSSARHPYVNPTPKPTLKPTTKYPTLNPTSNPTTNPSTNPTTNPISNPTSNPTTYPTKNPSMNPTTNPTEMPSKYPTVYPTTYPTANPTEIPTIIPTTHPTENPTMNPTMNPTEYPTQNPIELSNAMNVVSSNENIQQQQQQMVIETTENNQSSLHSINKSSNVKEVSEIIVGVAIIVCCVGLLLFRVHRNQSYSKYDEKRVSLLKEITLMDEENNIRHNELDDMIDVVADGDYHTTYKNAFDALELGNIVYLTDDESVDNQHKYKGDLITNINPDLEYIEGKREINDTQFISLEEEKEDDDVNSKHDIDKIVDGDEVVTGNIDDDNGGYNDLEEDEEIDNINNNVQDVMDEHEVARLNRQLKEQEDLEIANELDGFVLRDTSDFIDDEML